MIERFRNITEHVNKQQDVIETFLNSYNNAINNKIRLENDHFKYSQYINRINFNIDLLNSHLSNIAEAVVLARLNVISKQILNPTELNVIYEIFQNQYVKIHSDEQIYEHLGLQAYYNDTNIIFNIRIPIFSNKTYTFFHLIPLPINKTLSITTKPYITYHEIDTQYFDVSCPLIEGVYYCERSTSTPGTTEQECIPNVIKHIPANCEFLNGVETSTILQPEPNYILCINIPVTNLQSTCNIPTSKINGTVLIHFENCSVQINSIKYESKTNIYWESVIIHPILLSEIHPSKTTENLSMEKLQNYNFKNQESIKLLQIKTTLRDYYTFGPMAIILIAAGTFIIIHLKNHLAKKSENQQQTIILKEPTRGITTSGSTQDVPRTQLLWPSLHQRGEELWTQSSSDITGNIFT